MAQQNQKTISKKVEKYGQTLYKGPPIASYTKGNSVFFEGMGPLISPFLPGGTLDTFDINGKESTFVWRNFNFPENGEYIFQAIADESMEVFIGDATDKDNRVMRVSIEEGVKRVTRRVSRGLKTITLKLTNSNQTGTNYNLNPMFAGFKIIQTIVEEDDTDRRSWRQNPVGVSAAIIPPPCEKQVGGVGVVNRVQVTTPGNNYEPPPGTGYPVSLVIIGFNIVDPGINYSTGDPIEIIPGVLPPIIVQPFYPGEPPPSPPTPTPEPDPEDGSPLPPDIPPTEPPEPPEFIPEPPPTDDIIPVPPPPPDPGDPSSPITIQLDGFGRITSLVINPSVNTPLSPRGGSGDPGGGQLIPDPGGDGEGNNSRGAEPFDQPSTPPGGGTGDPFSPDPEPLTPDDDGDPPGPGDARYPEGDEDVFDPGPPRYPEPDDDFRDFDPTDDDGDIEPLPPPRPEIPIPPVTPKIRVLSQTGVNAQIEPIIGIVRDPLAVPVENIIQVTDLVGLKQTGYIDGRPYYGQVFTRNGIKYAGVYQTVGELIRVYDSIQESIDRRVTTPPSAIIRQGTDITSNDPRLNIPGTPEAIE